MSTSHAKTKHYKDKDKAMSSGISGYTSNTESGQATPQSVPGASTDGSQPGTSSGATIPTGQTTSSTGDPSAPR
ncbi:hypothetical protein [Sphingomonas bacterium]|uniref:hypothetical protein n=1 Tax=Sphingomonas bacterium TaxID=1895847 RepID=UPI0015764BB0|nr:hypothetical protein [Sphingomonas bacterium]